MKPQRATMTLMMGSLVSSLLGCVISTDDEDGGRVRTGIGNATGSDAGTPDAGMPGAVGSVRDAALGPTATDDASNVGVTSPGSNPTGVTASVTCEAALSAPGACVLPDPLEAAGGAAVNLTTSPRCGSAITTLASDQDEDVFRFTPPRSDPVRVELTYQNDKAAELGFEVHNQKEMYVSGNVKERTAPIENAVAYFVGNSAFAYDVKVSGTKLSGCQPYVLRVDPTFCGDDFEDNDSLAASAKPPWAADQTIAIVAKSFPNENDFYEFVPTKKDPVLLTGSYTREQTSKSDLNWQVTGSAMYITGDTKAPVAVTEEWRGWVFPHSAGEALQLEVSNDQGGCVPYQVKLDAVACTDAFEDNDTAKTAVVLPAQVASTATIISFDDDVYSLSALPNAGVCTIEYSVPTGSSQEITATLHSTTDQYVAAGKLASNGEQRTLTVQWSGSPTAGNLTLEAKNKECLSYTILCIAQ